MGPPESPDNGWWAKHVLKELERLSDSIEKLMDEHQRMREEVAQLRLLARAAVGLATSALAGLIARWLSH